MERPPVLFYRFNHLLHRGGIPVLPKIFNWLGRLIFACYLPASATIGKRFTLGYWGLGVVIHTASVIGEDCRIAQNVTIGRNFGDQLVPVIGNRVYIGAGSVLFGEITIGDNVVIGANSVVNKSWPHDSIIAGNPAKLIGTTKGKSYLEMDRVVK
ncbi:serine O-acetyltransferase [Neolewinella antarctica]|uniref:Serine O-acetyltransferase n=1 Tax=Neolewinella antarctica TaxID=442734 RepID=A0ABX0XA80_9BACT|nr:serine O-acetyltransferase [Neolewinella antarctica]